MNNPLFGFTALAVTRRETAREVHLATLLCCEVGAVLCWRYTEQKRLGDQTAKKV